MSGDLLQRSFIILRFTKIRVSIVCKGLIDKFAKWKTRCDTFGVRHLFGALPRVRSLTLTTLGFEMQRLWRRENETRTDSDVISVAPVIGTRKSRSFGYPILSRTSLEPSIHPPRWPPFFTAISTSVPTASPYSQTRIGPSQPS